MPVGDRRVRPRVRANSSTSKVAGTWRKVGDWTPEIVFLAVTTVAGLWARGRWVTPIGDPGIWWSLPLRLAEGETYYRDLYLQYGPFSPYFLSLAGQVFGFSATSILLWNWIPALVAGVLVLRASRFHLSVMERLAVTGMLLGVAIFAPGGAHLVYTYCPAAVHALCFALGAILLLAAREGRTNRRAFCAGALAGLALCAKQEIGIATLLALSVPAVTRSKAGLAWLGRCLAGFFIVAALGAVVVFGSASVESLRDESHLFPLGATSPESWKPLFRLVAGLSPTDFPRLPVEALRGLVFFAAMFAVVGQLLAGERRVSRLLPPAIVLAVMGAGAIVKSTPVWGLPFLPLSLSMTAAFFVSMAAFLDRRVPERDFLVGYGLFAGLVGLRTAFSGDASTPYSGIAHLPAAVTSAFFLLLFVPRLFPGGGAAALWTRKIWAVALLCVAWYSTAYGIGSLADGGHVPIDTPRGRVWASPDHAEFFNLLHHELRAGERILVLPETHAVDALYGLKDVSPFLIHLPGWLDDRAERNLLRKVSRKPPDAIVVFRRSTEEFGVRPFGEGFGVLLAGWIQRNYQVMARTAAGQILRPLARPASGKPE